MDNLWTKINNDIPMYMRDICEDYDLRCVKVSPMETALLGERFALGIAIDRFGIEVYYLCKMKDNIVKYVCGNYFAQAYDEKDRVNLLSGTGADVIVRNALIITSHGLCSKWESVLRGEVEWFEKYKKSSRYTIEKLTYNELKIIGDCLTVTTPLCSSGTF